MRNYPFALLSFLLALPVASSQAQSIKSPTPQSLQIGVPLGGQSALGDASRPDLTQNRLVPGLAPASIEIPGAPALSAPNVENAELQDAAAADPKETLKRLHESLDKADPQDVAAREQQLKAAFDHQAPQAHGAAVKYEAVQEDGNIRIQPYHSDDGDTGNFPTDTQGNPAVVSGDDAKLAPLLPSALDKPDTKKDWTGRMTLHLHSLFSDGTMTPEAVVEAAYKLGVRVLAVTDHDTVAGVVRAWRKAKELGMEFHTGAELTARGGVHIGALDIDIYSPKFAALVSRVRVARWARAQAIIKHLNALDELKGKNIVLTMAEVEVKSSHKDGGTIELPHIARVLLDKGLIHSVDEAFNKYLKGDIAGDSGAEPDPTVDEVLEAIHAAGGKAIFNHPYTVDGKDDAQKDERINAIIEKGMDGIEAYRPSNATSENGKRKAEERIKKYLKLADKYNLFAAPGADFHGMDTHLDHLVVWMPKILSRQTQDRLKDAQANALASLAEHNKETIAPPAPIEGPKLLSVAPLALLGSAAFGWVAGLILLAAALGGVLYLTVNLLPKLSSLLSAFEKKHEGVYWTLAAWSSLGALYGITALILFLTR